MDRRRFLATSAATLFSALAVRSLRATGSQIPFDLANWRAGNRLTGQGPAPRPEITAAVDVIVPPDPEIPGDFKGSDYGADWIVAAQLEDLGQIAVVFFLNRYARQAAGKKFLNCSPEEQLEAIKSWVRDREGLQPLLKDMLSGLLTLSVIGTFEENTPEEQAVLFESMGWFDPADPTGTFRLPNNGYPDSFQLPVRLKMGAGDD